MSLRATGDNEAMVRASSINSDAMKIMGITLANALVAFAGCIFAQYQNFADVSGGVGMNGGLGTCQHILSVRPSSVKRH